MSIQHLHNGFYDDMLTHGTRAVWFAKPAGGGGTGKTVKPTQADATEGKESLTESKLEEQRNARFIEKLDRLVGRKELSAETAEEAKSSFKTQDSQRKALARMLAKEQVDEAMYGQVNDALDGGTAAQKALGRLFIRRKITPDTFQNALIDSESGNAYRKELVSRLSGNRIDQEEFTWARRYVDSSDPAETDERRYAQQLARGDITPQAYRDQMSVISDMIGTRDETAVEATTDPVSEIQSDMHTRIIEVLEEVGVVMEALPEHEKTQPILKVYSDIHALNEQERTNHSALVGLLRPVVPDADEFKKILEYDADSKAHLDALRPQLSAMGIPAAEADRIMVLKTREYEIENRFNDLVEGARKVLEIATTKVENDVLERRMLENWSRSTGITIANGTKLEYIYPDDVHGNVRSLEIQRVETEYHSILDGNSQVIGHKPKGFKVFLNDGREWTMGQFTKWVDAVDAYESIDSQAKMQETLGLPAMGMSLKTGQTLEYREGFRRDEKGHVIPEAAKVKIRDISDNGVRLSEPVVTLTPEEAPGLGLTSPRMATELSPGEFVKWAKRHDMMPDIPTVAELKEHLRQYNTYANQQKFPNRKAELYPPLTLEPGEWLQPGDSRGDKIQIAKANDDGVTFKNGDKLTLPQFYKWAQDNNIERANPDDLANRQADAAETMGEPKKEAKENFLKRLKKAVATKPPDPKKPGKEGKVEPRSPFDYFTDDKPIGPFREVFYQYQFVSVMDLINMGKEIIEYIKRKHQRKSKMRYSNLGKALPGQLGTEFERVNQTAENEEVNQYKEAMGDWGTWQILGKLHATNSKDEAKACFIVLTEKGEFRWDDMNMWNTLNRLTSKFTQKGAKLFIPLSKEAVEDERGVKRSGEDRTKDAMDELWGEGTQAEWFSKNISTYNSKKDAYEYKGKQLEADPKGSGGLNGELQRLLNDWKAGEYVNPHEYEELVDFAIKYGKMSMEDKVFYLLEGVTAKCPGGPAAGQTLLHLDRLGDIDGKYLNQFPMLDFFTSPYEKPLHPEYVNGNITIKETKGNYKIKDYENFRDHHYANDSKKGKAGDEFSKFLWENMMMDLRFRQRLSKGLRGAQNMDHDDAHIFIPPATMEDIATITSSHNGAQKYFTNEGYKNGYIGYNQYLVSLGNRHEQLQEMMDQGLNVEPEQLQENGEQVLAAVQGYYLYDSYLDGRRDADDNRRARLGEARFDEYAVNDPHMEGGMKVKDHKAQLDNLVKDICKAYNLQIDMKLLFDTTPKYGERKEAEAMTQAMKEFLEVTLPTVIRKEGADKMIEIINNKKRAARGKPHDPNVLGGIPSGNYFLKD
jgi:hypothetical protein